MKHIYKMCLLIIISHLFLTVVVINGQAIDAGFYPVITNNDYAMVNASAVQTDGKILIAGTFRFANGFQQSGVARLMPDGKTDESFQPVTLFNGNYAGFVYDLKIQPDGKILIAGGLLGVNGQIRRGIARLNLDGSLDTSFAAVFSDVGYSVAAIAIQPDGKILVAGNYPASRNLIRLNGNGTVDGSFQNSLPSVGELTAMILQPDGRILVAYQIYENSWKTKIARLNSDGSLDSSFTGFEALGTGSISGGSPTVDVMLLQADGKTVIGGSFTSVAGVAKSRLARLNSDGTLDNSFQASADGAVYSLAMQPDDKILAGGIFLQINSAPRKHFARLNSDGSLDNSLSASFSDSFAAIQTISVQADGRIITGGQFLNVGGSLRYRVARLNADGSLDHGFAFVHLGTPGLVTLMTPRTDGKIFVAGSFSYVGGEYHNRLALINRDGTLEKSFRNVEFGDNFDVFAVIPLPDNKVLVCGRLFAHVGGRLYSNLVRFNADGTPDTSFTPLSVSSNTVTSLAIQSGGKILVGGSFYDAGGTLRNGIIRLHPDGSLDATFRNELSESGPFGVADIVSQPDGKILINGYFTQGNEVARSRIVRLNADGSIDTTFQNGIASLSNGNYASVYEIALQPDGKILVAGDFDTFNGMPHKYLVRLNADGSLNNEFKTNFIGADNLIFSVAVQLDGKILIAGNFNTINGQARRSLARLSPNGSLDMGFSVNFGTNFTAAYSLTVESNGNILVGGSFGLINHQTRAGLFRILNARPSPYDLDGDGKTDLSIFRPAAGEWWYSRSSDAGNRAFQFGNAADKIVPADYTGDGKTDIAFFRPSTNEWFVLRSEDNSFYSFPFGAAGDIPAPADYDGDGKADAAVFRATNTTWYILRSTGGTTIQQFGASGDVPTVADYDGDGKADIAIYRPTLGQWWLLRSTAGVIAFQFGASTDKPVQGDYTGDGKADIAFFRPSSGEWFVLRSENNSFYSFPFGTNGDIPAPGDYEGDGKTDAAVFRPLNNTWFVQRSASGTLIQTFGQTGDLPIPNAFVP